MKTTCITYKTMAKNLVLMTLSMSLDGIICMLASMFLFPRMFWKVIFMLWSLISRKLWKVICILWSLIRRKLHMHTNTKLVFFISHQIHPRRPTLPSWRLQLTTFNYKGLGLRVKLEKSLHISA